MLPRPGRRQKSRNRILFGITFALWGVFTNPEQVAERLSSAFNSLTVQGGSKVESSDTNREESKGTSRLWMGRQKAAPQERE